MTEQTLEQRLQAKTAPRVTLDDVEGAIVSEVYFTAADGCYGSVNGRLTPNAIPEPLYLLTFCVLILENGFTVTGESACASAENFDADIGREIARRNAVNKVWPLLGYELRTKLSKEHA